MSIAPETLENLAPLELAQILASKLAIAPNDWHRLKANRQAQASQQLAAALVYLLKNESQEAIDRIDQAKGWLDKSIAPLPCPTHDN